jgi:hypothetical protein
MKKKIALTVGIFFLALFVQAPSASTLESHMTWGWGVITDDSFSFKPFLWTAGFNLDLHLGPALMLSPEVYAIVHNVDFGAFILAPAVLLNFDAQGFFAGAGLTKWWLLGSKVSGAPSSDFSLKANAGFKGSGLKLTAFVITPFNDLFKSMAVGATLGFYF